jgi:hypothetical protein
MSLKSILFLGFLAGNIFAQSKSAVQFYDTTGATKTGKVGWTGDAASGHMFIQTPNEGEVIKTRAGGVDINGTVNATKFAGDGSLLTNLPAPAATTVGGVTGLQDSLNKKANTSDVTTLQGLVGAKTDSTSVNTKLSAKANVSDVTALQTLVSAKADTTMLKKKADTTWVMTKIGAAGGGTITGITAGSGLTGGGTTGTVSISIPNGAIDSSKIATGAITDAKIVGMSYSKLTGIPTGTGTITGVTADSGLSGGGTTGVVGLKLKYGGSGIAATVARSDHMHTAFDSLGVRTMMASSISAGVNATRTISLINDFSNGIITNNFGLLLNRSSGHVWQNAAGSVEWARIDANGNVGIGTTNLNPATKLTVNGSVEINNDAGSNIGKTVIGSTANNAQISIFDQSGGHVSILTGAGAPPSGTFTNGSIYLRSDNNGQLYLMQSGAWVLVK